MGASPGFHYAPDSTTPETGASAHRLAVEIPRVSDGVDKNIMAVDLAKLSLWLVTLAKDLPFTFLDHALRHGDAPVGLTREQIIGFHTELKSVLDETTDDELEDSPVVANCIMNRERDLRGSNGYEVEVGFDPLEWLQGRLARQSTVRWLDLCCGKRT